MGLADRVRSAFDAGDRYRHNLLPRLARQAGHGSAAGATAHFDEGEVKTIIRTGDLTAWGNGALLLVI